MIYEHEIPLKSRLYFAKSASVKREIEFHASKILQECGYQEIVTPYFSYHQHQEIDEKKLIRINDKDNHILTLRADSTLDVVRLITKRLGRTTDQKRWFYIQPVFRSPTSEQYQIGAEYLGNCTLLKSIDASIKILEKLELKPHLQISNMMIPKLLSKELDISINYFKDANLQEIFSLGISWLSDLASLQKKEDISRLIDEVPSYLKDELKKIELLTKEIKYDDIIVAPLYYAKMRYYDGLFYRFFTNNKRVGQGGLYNYEGECCSGFALYTDNIIEELINR
ncbi:MAG: ATP phosphoribosyltransferase regulatory subunit [Sulfurospirillum sp.]|nr:MAG: ATP phosphoribosyltransferase regulatory subunit [Sulfurospirillum sp.]